MADLLPFAAITAAGGPRVGGKAAALAELAAAGLPVPAGFVLTTDAYHRLFAPGIRSDAAFAGRVVEAFRELGGRVAVRSSAVGEDGEEDSFAGQQETVLAVATPDDLLTAIERCWQSLHGVRARAYRRERGVPDDAVATAVVVQRLVEADTAGVLFTQDPTRPDADRMIVEAAYGLGEVVVSGRVTPDRFAIDRATGSVVERHAGRKTVRMVGGRNEPVPAELQDKLCLTDVELHQLADLGRRVEAHYGRPRDVEWASAGGSLFLLQARPITTAAADREAVRQEVIAGLRAEADPRGTVWVRYNLSEILPRPTPMTWAVVQHLLSADGGIGRMNRDLGGDPDPTLGGRGAFDLVAGRPMANLSRLPRLQLSNSPFEYPVAACRADPRAALDPKPVLNPLRAGVVRGLLRLPGLMWRLSKMGAIARRQAATFAAEFRSRIVPPFAAGARLALAQDWAELEPAAVVRVFEDWTRRTLVDFARHSLKPTFLAEYAWTSLVETLKPKLGEERARAAVGELAVGAKPDPETHLAAGFDDLAAGRIGREAFLERFGHRGANEMELAAPRWCETPAVVPGQSAGEKSPPGDETGRVLAEAKLTGPAADAVRKQADDLRTFLGLRETAKHYLLLGYAVVRRALVELDRHYGLRGGVFELLPEELPRLIAGDDLRATIAVRRKRRKLELTLDVPPVLFGDDLDAIGRPVPVPEGTTAFDGTPLSPGVADGPALVLTEPRPPAEGEEGFVLVCPSTDPAWVPLFARARALVMETGGVLSHGAIVAREFGLPAVAGLPDATRLFRTGQPLRVDGGTGSVAVLTASGPA